MIDFIKGRLVLKSPTYVVIETGGIGYGFVVSLNTFSALKEIESELKLFSYTIIKDERLQSYGFISEMERGLFIELIGIGGIGPRIALTILSEIEPSALTEIIQRQNAIFLSKIKGIGEKTAKRIILELSGKLSEDEKPEDKGLQDSCISALLSLGYSKKEADKACKMALSKGINNLQELIKEALRWK